MSIKTDSLSIDSPKNPDACNVFKLYSLIGKEKDVIQMKEKYKNGGYGYGEAKKELFELIIQTYSTQREKYNYLMDNKNEMDQILKEGSKKAKKVADQVIKRVKSKLGI